MIFKKMSSIGFKEGGNKVLHNNDMLEGLELSLPHHYIIAHVKNLRLTINRILA